MEDGKNWNHVYTVPGPVNITDLNCYFNQFHQKSCLGDVETQSTAHAYGQLALNSECGKYEEIGDVVNDKLNFGYFCRKLPNRRQFAFRFKEYNYDDHADAYPRLTNRTVTASSGKCFEYRMVNETNGRDASNLKDAKVFTYTNGTFTGNISIPTQKLGREGTTYIYRGIKVPKFDTTYSCGPRCMRMWAFKNPGPNDGDVFYECPITISDVSNTWDDSQVLSNDVAREAAVSIALEGRWAGSFENMIFTQFQFYAAG